MPTLDHAVALLTPFLALGSQGQAQDTFPKTLEELPLGIHWLGRDVDHRELAGKVVIIISWGPGEPGERCAGQMLRMVNGLKDIERQGTRILFNVVSSKLTRENAAKILARLGSIPEEVSVRCKAGAEELWLKGYPSYGVYDHTGTLAKTHHGLVPEDHDRRALEPALKALLKKRPWIDLGPEPFKRLQVQAASIIARLDLATTYQEVEKTLAATEDAETKAEATHLWDAIVKQAQIDQGMLAESRARLPRAAIDAVKKAGSPYEKTSLAKRFTDLMAEWRKDAELRKAIAVEKRIIDLMERVNRLPTCPRCRKKKPDLFKSCPQCTKLQAPRLRRLENAVKEAGRGYEKLLVYEVAMSCIAMRWMFLGIK